MKSLLLKVTVLTVLLFVFTQSNAQLRDIIQHAKDKTADKVNNGVDKAVDNSGNSSNNQTNNTNNNTSTNTDQSQTNSDQTQTAQSAPPSVKSYQNYDFVPGDTVLFADDFTEEQDGEFPSHWDLEKGQAVVNKLNGKSAFYLTEGNYVQVYPLM